jgi:hypothetical protein
VSRGYAALATILGVALPLAFGQAAAAHWTPPEAIVAELNAGSGHEVGVEGAERDAKVPRLLVIRVGDRWYTLAPAARRAQAADWLGRWRASVDQGIVAVLDLRTAKPVVEFGPWETIKSVAETPP